ncbi:GLYL3 protein, partial [Corythaixoides concolor]|nr:GLYL3 protein [Corythaixoides concolor]
MLILTCPAQLQRLEETLRRSLPLALPVYGAVMNINRGNPAEFEVVVDSWPNFGAVLARRSREVASGAMGRGGHMVPWHMPSGLRTPLAPSPSPGEPPSRPLPVAGSRHRPLLMAAPRHRLAPGVRVGSLSPAHVDLLNETWTYGGNARSRRYLAELLELFPSLCLQDATGQPLCWALTDPFGTGTHGYTLPAQRRRGLMRAVLTLATQRAQARGFPYFG